QRERKKYGAQKACCHLVIPCSVGARCDSAQAAQPLDSGLLRQNRHAFVTEHETSAAAQPLRARRADAAAAGADRFSTLEHTVQAEGNGAENSSRGRTPRRRKRLAKRGARPPGLRSRPLQPRSSATTAARAWAGSAAWLIG